MQAKLFFAPFCESSQNLLHFSVFPPTAAGFEQAKDYLQRKCTLQDICCCSDNFPQIEIFRIFSKSHCALPRSPEADFERRKVAVWLKF